MSSSCMNYQPSPTDKWNSGGRPVGLLHHKKGSFVAGQITVFTLTLIFTHNNSPLTGLYIQIQEKS